MLEILVLTKNHPVEIMDVCARIHSAVTTGTNDSIVNSPQFIAEMISKAHGVPYIQAYYPALRAYKNIESYMIDSKLDILITVGTVDVLDKNNYDAIVGIDNKEIKDYDVFDEDFNTTEMKVLNLQNADIMFDTMEELIHFLRIAINNYRKENNNELQ